MSKIYLAILTLVLTGCALVQPAPITLPLDTELNFTSPRNLTQVKSPVIVGAKIEGEEFASVKTKTGIYVLVNTPVPPLSKRLPKKQKGFHLIENVNKTIRIPLTTGQHQLQLIAVDGWRRAHHPPLVSEIITIDVKP